MQADVTLNSGKVVRIVAVPSLGGPILVDCGTIVLVQSRCPLVTILKAIVSILNTAGAAAIASI